MRRPVPPHYTPGIGDELPAAALFEPHIERADGHWWWGGDFKRFDCDNFAVLEVPYRVVTRGSRARSGLWIVARALWQHANGHADGGKFPLVSTCGSTPCVNPAHVERPHRASHFTLLPDARMNDGVRVELARVGGRVHVVPVDVEHAVCGWRIRERRDAAVGAVITCVECLSMWRARGYPLQEVPA